MAQASGGGGLVTGSTAYLAANLVNAAVPFLLLPVLTRVLGPAQYGQVAVFQALVGALVAVTSLSVQGAANRRYFDAGVAPGELARFVGTCVLVVAAATAATALVLAGVLEPLAEWTGLEPAWVLWAVLAAGASGVVSIALGQWQVRGQALRYGALQCGIAVALALLTLVLVLGIRLGAEGRIAAQLWVALAAAAIALVALRAGGHLSLAWSGADARAALAFGLPLVPHVAGIFLLSTADRLVIKDALGLEAAGVYMVAVQLALALSVLADAFNKAYVPWLYARLARDSAGDKAAIVRGTYLYFGVALALAGALFVLAPWLVPLLAGPGFDAAARLVGWLALGQAFHGMYLMVTNYVFYSRRTASLSLVTIGMGALNVALAVVLVRAIGLEGVAIAFAAVMGVRFLLTWAVAQRLHPMPWFAPVKHAT